MAGSERDEDDDSILDPSEQLNRPSDIAFNQQRIQAWNPILDPVWAIVAFFYMGIIMVPVGMYVLCCACAVAVAVCVLLLFVLHGEVWTVFVG